MFFAILSLYSVQSTFCAHKVAIFWEFLIFLFSTLKVLSEFSYEKCLCRKIFNLLSRGPNLNPSSIPSGPNKNTKIFVKIQKLKKYYVQKNNFFWSFHEKLLFFKSCPGGSIKWFFKNTKWSTRMLQICITIILWLTILTWYSSFQT